MKVEKLQNGSYRIRPTINGKRVCITFDHRPTQKEINAEIDARNHVWNGKLTMRSACESYIESRSNTLSPSTLREYNNTIKRLSEPFLNSQIDMVTTNDVQREINSLAATRSPKTVRNYHGFISAVLGEFRPDLALHTHLPMKDKTEPYIPTKEDIKALIEYSKGTIFEVPILLGCASLRRGEICALEPGDIEGNVIHITKDMVLDDELNWVIKKPKTLASIRDVVVPDQVIDAINRNGLYKGHPNSITKWMDRTEKKLGMQHFSLHKCRHYFASAAHEAGVSDADIQKAGGWATDYVMKTIYRHSLAKDNSAATDAVFDTIL